MKRRQHFDQLAPNESSTVERTDRARITITENIVKIETASKMADHNLGRYETYANIYHI